jgi:hypothetical protein
MWQHLHPYAYKQSRQFQSVPGCDLQGRGDRQCFWFLQVDAKGPAEIAKPAEDGILIGVSRVSCLMSHLESQQI